MNIYRVLLALFGERLFLRAKYYYRVRRRLHLAKPITFSEKLQWLKLNEKLPVMTVLADKIECKEWVSNSIGSEYVIPLLKVFNSPNEISLESIPTIPFVLKASHDSGGVKVIGSEAHFDQKEIQQYYQGRMASFYYLNLEWEYKNIAPRVFAEELLVDDNKGLMLRDYKVHCFNGQPRFIQTISDREEIVKENWFNTDWELQDMWYFSPHKADLDRPQCLEELLDLSQKLARPFNYVRVDFYWTGGQVFFGEFTFRPYGGFMVWNREEVDNELGELLKLNKV